MIDLIHEPLTVLCDEVGLPMPALDSRGVCALMIEGHELRFAPMKHGKVVMTGVIGKMDFIASNRNVDLQTLLARCLTLCGARLAKLCTREVMTVEPEYGELVLWLCFDPISGVSISNFLGAAESMLNELEFWKKWLVSV